MRRVVHLLLGSILVLAVNASALASVTFETDGSAHGCANMGTGGLVLLAGCAGLGMLFMKSRH